MIYGRPPQLQTPGLGQYAQVAAGIASPQQVPQRQSPLLHPAILAQLAQLHGLGGYGFQSPQIAQGLGRSGIQPLSAASVSSLR